MGTGDSFRQAITSLVARKHGNVGLSITVLSTSYIMYGVTVIVIKAEIVYGTVNL